MSHIYPDAHLSKNTVSALLDALGSNLHNQRNFFEYLSKSSSYMAVDLTHIFSESNKMGINELGYNPDHIWNPQINLLLIWAIDNRHPAFFKVLPGSINSVSSLIDGIKGRKDIENAFYALKHGIECDKTWMQDGIKLRGFFFIAFISLYLYTRILDHLSRKGLLSEYSVPDVLSYLSSVHVVDAGGTLFWSEIPKSCKELIERLEISITQKL